MRPYDRTAPYGYFKVAFHKRVKDGNVFGVATEGVMMYARVYSNPKYTASTAGRYSGYVKEIEIVVKAQNSMIKCEDTIVFDDRKWVISEVEVDEANHLWILGLVA